MSAFLPSLPLPTLPTRRAPCRHATPRRRVACARTEPAPSAADLLALLPDWAIRPAVPPGTSVPHADAQWANFKHHLGSRHGDWTYYDATLKTGGAPIKHLHSCRSLQLDAPEVSAKHGVRESVTHTNTLAEQFPDARPSREQHMRYSHTKPTPTWMQPIRSDGSLAPPLQGVCLFQPVTGGAWHDGSLAAGLLSERLVLHPHLAGARFSVAARLAHDGVRTLFLVREEEAASRSALLASESRVFSPAMDVARLEGADESALADMGTAGDYQFVVVEHSLTADLQLSTRVFMAEHPPTLPVGADRVALRMPDGICASLPPMTGASVLGASNAMHLRWKLDRGTWLHAHSTFGEDGEHVVDRTAVYYPL